MSRSKRIGTAWETAVVDFLEQQGLDPRRQPPAGARDVGDIHVEDYPWLIIEAKADKSFTLAKWVAQANVEAENAGRPVGIAWAKRPGKTSPGSGYVIMDGETFLELLELATGPGV